MEGERVDRLGEATEIGGGAARAARAAHFGKGAVQGDPGADHGEERRVRPSVPHMHDLPRLNPEAGEQTLQPLALVGVHGPVDLQAAVNRGRNGGPGEPVESEAPLVHAQT